MTTGDRVALGLGSLVMGTLMVFMVAFSVDIILELHVGIVLLFTLVAAVFVQVTTLVGSSLLLIRAVRGR